MLGTKHLYLHRYVISNAKLSSFVVDTLLPEIPPYLHNRPHWFVRHCISRMQNTEDLVLESVGKITDDACQVIIIELRFH